MPEKNTLKDEESSEEVEQGKQECRDQEENETTEQEKEEKTTEVEVIKEEVDEDIPDEDVEELSRDELEEEVEELESSLKKVMADFDNYRKRTIREKKDIIESATEDLMTDLLQVLDDFERALYSDDPIDDEGVEMIYRKFFDLLQDHGLEEVDAEDIEFDPHYHECVMSVETDDDDEKNMVVEQFQKGYKLNSKVIRPAKVKVAK